MFRIRVVQTVLSRSVHAMWITLLAALASPDALSGVRDCEAVSAGLAEPVVFAAPSKSGNTLQVRGVLRKPVGDRKLPALVVLHGGGGVRPPRCYRGAIDVFTSWGYVTLLIDSPSQTDQTGVQRYEYSFEDQGYHAQGAAAFLASLPYVDSDRIGIVGWSKGGAAVLVAVSESRIFSTDGKPLFQAAVAIYPYPDCLGKLENLDTPLLVLIGEEDTEVFVTGCKDMKVVGKADVEYQLKVYPGVGHLFDFPRSPNYDEAAATDADNRQRQFFAKYLQR